jgi:ubiquinol-cytochrome c reductase cytochrome b subunit
MLSQACAAYYFAHFLIILPILSRLETPPRLPNSITEAVLKGKSGATMTETALSA